MKRLDLYIASAFARYLLLSLSAFLLLFVAISVFDELNVFIRFDATLTDAALLILARAPLMLAFSMPLSCLLAALATVTIMSRSGEITALRASGISLVRLARPLVFCGLCLGVVHFALLETVVPLTQTFAQEVRTVRIMKKKPKTLLRDRNFWFKFEDSMIHADRIDPGSKEMEGVTVFERAGTAIQRTITAKSARWNANEWVLSKVRARKFLPEGGWEETLSESLPYPVAIAPDELSVIILEPENTSMATLGRRIESSRLQGADVTALTVEYWKRTVLPFASLLMPFLAIPFGIRSTHRSSLWGTVGTGVTVGLVFLSAIIAGGSLGKAGLLPPLAAAWSGYLAFLPIAFFLMRRAER